MKRKAEHEELPRSKLQRSTKVNSLVTFNCAVWESTPYSAKNLASFLNTKLNRTSRKWSGRVILRSNSRLCLYDVLAKRQILDIPTAKKYDPDITQLNDGTIVVCQNDTISLYNFHGDLIQTTECEQYLPHSIELRNGNILFISNNSAQSVAGIFDRKANTVEELCRSTFEYISVAQFKDGRIIFSDGGNVDLYDESLNHLQAFEDSEWMEYYSQHRKDFQFFSAEGDYFEVNTDEFTWQGKRVDDASVALELENGILVLKSSRPQSLMFARGTVVFKTIEEPAKLLTEIDFGVVAYYNKSTKQVHTYDTNTDERYEYTLPDDASLELILKNIK
jgi:hypothetical protein